MLNGKIDGFQFPVNFSHHPILRGTENTSHQKKRIKGLGKKDIRTLAQMAFPISDSFSESVGHLLTKVGLKWFIMVYHHFPHEKNILWLQPVYPIFRHIDVGYAGKDC